MDLLDLLDVQDNVSMHSIGTQTSLEPRKDDSFHILMSPPILKDSDEELIHPWTDRKSVSKGTSVRDVPEMEAIKRMSLGRPRIGSTVGKVSTKGASSPRLSRRESKINFPIIELQQTEFEPADLHATGIGLRGVATSGLDGDMGHFVGIGWINVGSMGDAEAERIPPMVRGPISDEDRRKALDARAGRASEIVNDILCSAMKGAMMDADDPTKAVNMILESVLPKTETPGIDVIDDAIYSAMKAAVETPATLVGEALHSIVSAAGVPKEVTEGVLDQIVDDATRDARRMAGDVLDKVLGTATSENRRMASDVLEMALGKTMGVHKDIAKAALQEAIAKAQKYPHDVAGNVLKAALSNAFGVPEEVANDALQAALIAALTAPYPEPSVDIEASLLSLAEHHVPAVEMLSGDFASPPLRICPADLPKGSRPQYDLDALTKHQQRRLNQLKRATARDDQRYLSQHPEIRAICALLLGALLREQPVMVRDFCSRWVERPNLRQEVDAYLSRFRPPSRHDDPKELRDWFPVPEKPTWKEVEEERWHESPEAAALRRRERELLQAAHARLRPRSVIIPDLHEEARGWVEELISRTLGAPSITWDTFEEEFQALLKERKRTRRRRSKQVRRVPLTKGEELLLGEASAEESSESEAMPSEFNEAKAAVEAALRELEEQTFEVEALQMIQHEMEMVGEQDAIPDDDIARMETTRRMTAVAEALRRLRKVSRTVPQYEAILQNAISRLQQHQERELTRVAKRLPERALQWTAILQGGRASVFAQRLEMEEAQNAMTAALGIPTHDRGIGEGGVHAGEQAVSLPTALEMGRGHKKKMRSRADNERYTLRLSIAFPELAGMLHEGEKKSEGPEGDRAGPKGKRSPGRSMRVRRAGAGPPSLGDPAKKESAGQRKRATPPPPPQKRLTRAVVFEGKDPLGKEAQWRTKKGKDDMPKISIMDFMSDKQRSTKIAPDLSSIRASRVSAKGLAEDLQERVERYPAADILEDAMDAAVPMSKVSRASKVSRSSRMDGRRMTSATEEIAANAVKAATEDSRSMSIAKEMIQDTLGNVEARRDRFSKTAKK